MRNRLQVFLVCVFAAGGAEVTRAQEPVAEAVILYTNDFHSAVDPIPAYWLDESPRLGGAAQLSTLVDQIRARENPAFLFDTGDMFTGMLSFLTKGEAMMEMMDELDYDAMAIGNHEFDYGSANFRRQMDRVPFPILGANIFYAGSNHPYSRPYTILTKGDVRLGVIGVIGHDARSVALASGITDLEFRDPAEVVRQAVRELEDDVDLIVVLAHQGKTGPMQTDAENRPELQRDFDADIELCRQVPEIDVLVGGHAHRGIEEPYVHPETGCRIVQTYGYGTRLGYLKVWFSGGRVIKHEGELLPVWSDQLPPDPGMEKRLAPYREVFAREVGEAVGQSTVRLTRRYRAESLLGAFVTDVMRERTGAEIAITNAGGLRADLPEGRITRGDVLDALPFQNTVVTMDLTGKQLREVVEQGLTLERGMVQASGLQARYDLGRPAQQRLLELTVKGRPVAETETYRVATNSFLADGGDLYRAFTEGRNREDTGILLSTVVTEHLKTAKPIAAPEMGRFRPVEP